MIPTNRQTSRFWRHWSCIGEPTWEFRPFWGRPPDLLSGGGNYLWTSALLRANGEPFPNTQVSTRSCSWS